MTSLPASSKQPQAVTTKILINNNNNDSIVSSKLGAVCDSKTVVSVPRTSFPASPTLTTTSMSLQTRVAGGSDISGTSIERPSSACPAKGTVASDAPEVNAAVTVAAV